MFGDKYTLEHDIKAGKTAIVSIQSKEAQMSKMASLNRRLVCVFQNQITTIKELEAAGQYLQVP